MATRITLWDQKPAKAPAGTLWGGGSAGGSDYYTGGGSFGVGMSRPRERETTGGVLDFGLQPGTPGYAATQKAYWDKQGDFEAALDALRGGQFMPQGTPQAAMGMFQNPRGFDPRALQGRIAAATDLEAGSRGNALDALRRAAAARGFGNSAAALDIEARTRAGSAANLQRSLNEMFYENERAKLQQQGMGASLLSGLSASEAAMIRARADALMGRPRDVIPGISDGAPGSSGFKYLNERGELIPRAQWTQHDWEQAMRERALYARGAA